MTSIPKVLIDTSTLIGAAILPASVPLSALIEVVEQYGLVCSAETLDEFAAVLARPKFDRYLDSARRLTFLDWLRSHIALVHVTESHRQIAAGVCRDPKDDKFLALALAAEADVLIASDQDLLVLHPWRRLAILTPQQFLDWSAVRRAED